MNGHEFEQAVKSHQQWKSGSPGGHPGLFSGKRIENVELKGADLSEMRFVDCAFVNVTLRDVDLSNVVFSGSQFTDVRIVESKVVHSRLNKALMNRVKFIRCEIEDTQFDEGVWDGVEFEHSKVLLCSFASLTCSGAKFSVCNVYDCGFGRANMLDVIFETCIMSDCRMSHMSSTGMRVMDSIVTGVEFDKSDIMKSAFIKNNMSECTFIDAVCDNSSFIDNEAVETTFRGARLDGVSFKGGDMSRSDFSGASLRLASFCRASAYNCKFYGTDMFSVAADNTNFAGSTFLDVNMANAAWRGCDADNTRITDANMVDVQMCRTSFEEAHIEECNVNEAGFADCNFNDAQIAMLSGVNTVFDMSDFEGTKFNVGLVYPSFAHCNIGHAEFSGRMRGAVFNYADIRSSDLRGNMNESVWHDVEITRSTIDCQFDGSSFRHVTWYRCNLADSTFRDAHFENSFAPGSNFVGADMAGSNAETIRYTSLTSGLQPAPEGTLTGYTYIGNSLVKLHIDRHAPRLRGGTCRHFRTNKATVLSIDGCNSGRIPNTNICTMSIIQAVEYDPNRWNEWGRGIIFFLTQAEAGMMADNVGYKNKNNVKRCDV